MFIISILACSEYENKRFIFIGDSHVNLWQTDYYFGNHDLENIGVGGYTISNVIQQIELLETSEMDVAIVEIGYNDISGLGAQNLFVNESVLILKNRFVELFYKLNSLFSEIVVLSVIPHSIEHKGEESLEITNNINLEIELMCKEFGFMYIDISSRLKDDNGMLDLFLTTEGIHLNSKGYDLISQKCYEIF